MTYKATTINGEPKLEPVNPYKQHASGDEGGWFIAFKKLNPPIPYIGSAIPDGTILDESEVEIKHEAYSVWTKSWHDVNVDKLNVYAINDIPARRVATLKAKEPEITLERFRENAIRLEPEIDKLLEKCEALQALANSEEGEQPMKEERPVSKGMTELKIYQFQAEQIDDTLRMVSNLLKSIQKKTSLDRDIMQSWEMIKNIIDGNPDKHVSRF